MGGVPVGLRRRDRQQRGHVGIRMDALFQHRADDRAEIALFAQNKPKRRLVRPHRPGAAAMPEAVAVAAGRANTLLRQHNCVTGFDHRPPPPLFGGGALPRRAQSRRAEHVGQEVGSGGI
jgi:hypothetical protein